MGSRSVPPGAGTPAVSPPSSAALVVSEVVTADNASAMTCPPDPTPPPPHRPGTTSVTVLSTDGVRLGADVTDPDARPRGTAVLGHPHPLFGGSRHDAVLATVAAVLVAHGWRVVRPDFRGAGDAGGVHGGGGPEVHDLTAAAGLAVPGQPLVMGGYSFGADVALACAPSGLVAWLVVAPPLSVFAPSTLSAAHDPRPKLVVVAAHDTIAPPGRVATTTGDWPAARLEVVEGTDHFFLGASDALSDTVSRLVSGL